MRMEIRYIIALCVSIVLIGGSFYAGQKSVNIPTFGSISQAKQTLLEDNVEQYTRLKEAPVWDTDIISTEEMSNAYINVAYKYGVTNEILKESGGNLQLAIQKKMSEQSVLCNDSKTNQI